MNKALVIFNPHAGRGRGAKRAESVVAALNAVDFEFDSVVSESRGHAVELAQRAVEAGRELIVAAGGDGTLNEVVNGILQADEHGKAARLGVMPIGSGNDFSGALGITTDLQQAAEVLKRGHIRRIDVGTVNGRYFANNVGIGFEAQVNIEAHKMTWLKGQMMYLAAILRATVSFPHPVVQIDRDSQRIENKSILMVTAGNNRRIGGGFLVFPEAVPDDGLLDLCVVDAIPRREILRLLPKLPKGHHVGEPVVEMTRFTHLVVESENPLPVHADGEILWNDVHRVEIEVLPDRLDVVA
ncbi:MAG: diacylglycerol kinase family lipid kinase [Anaerolineae bacterium]|nr:diacylglycerol kinase family lipid kinase [Anaerolineae bacterium]MCB0227745.1 diacylglycerol kinase family lipid kinase [Anaerolineae bacterium]MCB0235302.1 diacylglycerol kinase family lipid kinase [Anaerolineae bacterium]MCB0240463.1 diacylglycerol kinase family lipid kinase [Anaerolineae bacterium]MCB0246669.1 diacylglycerol kinase family lipid kinase [Anaerolineae bacterium]